MDTAETLEATPGIALLLGPRMRALRLAHGLSQEGLARRAEVSRETVRRVEAGGGTTTEMLDRLLRVMDSDAEELLATRAKRNGAKRPRLGVLPGQGNGSEPSQQPLLGSAG